MISVSNLNKSYGPRVAVDNVTFEVQKGEIVGFLGPNGAGKSTTMKILSGFMPASDGKAASSNRQKANNTRFMKPLQDGSCKSRWHCPDFGWEPAVILIVTEFPPKLLVD
mgnify:CR=1 FL=1